MDDDNGLELSLGLSCGGGKAKGANNNAGTSSENHHHNVEGDNRSAKVIDDFKNFLHPTTSQRPPAAAADPSSEPPPPPQNFFNDLSKAPTSADAAEAASTKPLWVEDEAMKEAGSSKRKFGFQEMNDEKKKKAKASLVSNATDEGSTADNEDVAESEAGGGDLAKDVVVAARPAADMDSIAGQRKSNHVEEFTANRNMSYNVPFTVHPHNVITGLPYSLPGKESGQHGAAAGTSVTQPTAGNLPVMFGYSPVQLPMLDKDGSGGVVTRRGPSNSVINFSLPSP
ncbi:AFP-like protein 2 [Raphanus sativus]|nr:AFP-like protein 2 [Raphanus sativus]